LTAHSLYTRARPRLAEIAPYEPGKPIAEVERELGLTGVVKLASNENPLGPSPRALEAVGEALRGLHRYPDGAAFELRSKLAVRHGVSFDSVVMGNGSTELVELVAEAFIGDGEEAVIGRYEFFKYRIAVQIMNGVVCWAEMPGLGYDPDALLRALTPRTKVLFIANPNNPTGTLLDRDGTDYLINRVPGDLIVVFDEAYYDYRVPEVYPDTLTYVREGRPVIVFRTFSKSYGLAGLRVGYAIAPLPLANALQRVRETFNVNSLGQAAALAALDDDDFLARSIALNREQMMVFESELLRLGLKFVPSAANFLLVRTLLPGRELFNRLLRLGVVVRPVDSYGLNNYVRVSIGLPEENRRFFDTLGEVVG